MIKKYSSCLVIFLVMIVLVSGCKNEKNENSSQTTQNSENHQEVTEVEATEIEETEDFDFKEQAVGYDVYDTTWEQEVYTYAGEELQMKFEIASMPVQAEFSFLVFIDGVLTPYCSNVDSVYSKRQLFKTEKGEKKSEYTLSFKPAYGKKGETYDLEVLLLDNPQYMLKDTSWLSFAPNHSIMTVSKKKLDYQADTIKNEDISNTFEVRDLTAEVENEFANDYAEGGNNLNAMLFFTFLTEPMDSKENREEGQGYLSVKKGEKLKLYLPFLGLSGEYRVSLYINYEPIAAFDGKNYFDVTVQRDKYTEKKIELDLSKYSGLNHIEMFVADKSGSLNVLGSGPMLIEITE